MNACSNIGAFILEMSLDTPFVVFAGKFDLRSDFFDHGTLCVLCVQDIGQSGQTGVYVVCLQEQNRELEPVWVLRVLPRIAPVQMKRQNVAV